MTCLEQSAADSSGLVVDSEAQHLRERVATLAKPRIIHEKLRVAAIAWAQKKKKEKHVFIYFENPCGCMSGGNG